MKARFPSLLACMFAICSGLLCSQTTGTPPVQSYPSANVDPAGKGSICQLKNKEVQVKLSSPLSTSTAKQGDAFTTTIDSPPELQGGVIEGQIASLTKAEKGFGQEKPKMALTFKTMTVSGRSCPINGELKSVANSKGVKSVDEEGRAIGSSSNKKRVLGTAGGALFGAAVGALSGGATGAAVGAAAGAAAGFVLTSTMTAAGTDIDFQPGSVFTLQVSSPAEKGRR